MADMSISETVLQKLVSVAERENRSLDDLLESLLDEHLSQTEGEPVTLADFTRFALAANIASQEAVDTAERSREILETEFAAYLNQHLSEDNLER